MSGFQNDPGTVQQEAGFGFLNNFWTESAQDGITASATQSQAGATPLTFMFNRVTTVASIGNAVRLPPGILGLSICIINAAANAMQVYADSSDTVSGLAGSAGVSHMGGSTAWYTCVTPRTPLGGAAVWTAQGLGNGQSGQLPTYSFQAGLTAHSGGGQGSAVAITASTAFFSTVGAGGDSAVLPSAQPGMEITVVNQTATSMNVFPASGQTINGAAANTAVAVVGGASGSVTIFYCAVAGSWWTK
jgi:hypothetical protein